jgi:protein SHQ1
MITPKFSIRQDANRLYITIYLPHIRASTDIEFQVDSNVFIFSLSPYYLRLRFSHALLNDEDERVIDDETLKSTLNYNASDCTVEISIAKEIPGQEFEDLDLLTKLLARAKNPDHRALGSSGDIQRPLIQEMGGDNSNPSNQEIDAHFSRLQSEAEEFDWELPQILPTEEEDGVNMTGKAQYGFNRQYSGEIGVTMATGANDVNEYPEPEQSVPGQRAEFRAQLEALAFDADYYLADTFDNPDIAELIRWKSPTNELFAQFTANSNNDDLIKFTEEEQQAMTRLPKKQYFLDNPKRIYLGLLAILFATLYDVRTTQNDPTVESAWTITKLCPLLAALDDNFSTVREVLQSCLVRAVSFPLYRHYELACHVVRADVYETLRLGRRAILRHLLLAKRILDTAGEPYYVYSRIWLDDYCNWVQYASDEVLRSMAHEVRKVSLEKGDILAAFDVVELEEAAREALAEQAAAEGN